MALREVNLCVDSSYSGMRLDAFLAKDSEVGASRSVCAHIIEGGFVTVNSKVVTSKKYQVKDGDRITLKIEIKESADKPLTPSFRELDIAYDDEYLCVINKSANLVCHPSPSFNGETLCHMLVGTFGYEHLGCLQGIERPGLVHRLDKDTTGLMLVAKNDKVQEELQNLIRTRVLDRRYIALVQGYVAPDTGMIDVNIARSAKDRLKMTTTTDASARSAITTFRTLDHFEAGAKDDGYSLLECHLYTGRTHQIRVHMAHINHQVVGDPLYGMGDAKRNLNLGRQFLHSYKLEFDHPVTGEHLNFICPLPSDLTYALNSIMNREMAKTAAGEEIIPLILK